MAATSPGHDEWEVTMRRYLIAFAFAAVTAPVIAQTAGVTVMPNEMKYAPIPFAPGVNAAWIFGGPDVPGIYTVRVRMTPDLKIPPHTHPDTRMITVLSGELYRGAGHGYRSFDRKALSAGHVLYRARRRAALCLGEERRSDLSGVGQRSVTDGAGQVARLFFFFAAVFLTARVTPFSFMVVTL